MELRHGVQRDVWVRCWMGSLSGMSRWDVRWDGWVGQLGEMSRWDVQVGCLGGMSSRASPAWPGK